MTSLRFPTIAVSLFALTLSPTLRSQPQPITVLNDTFADSERLTQSWPSSAGWYQNTAQAANLSVRNGALNLVVANGSRVLWSYFPAVNLNVGESLTLTLEFSFTTPLTSPGGFRAGLLYTNGVDARPVDGVLLAGNYEGYCISDNLLNAATSIHLNKRNGPGAANADAVLMNSFGAGDQTIWQPLTVAGQIRGMSAANTPYTLVLRVTRTGADTASLTTSLTGGALSSANTVTLTDAAGIFTRFDTLALALLGNSTSGDLVVTRANLVATIAASTAGRLVNMSIRTSAGTGDNTLIVGLGVGGAGTTGKKSALFRGVGATLGSFGVGGALADPVITAYQGTTQLAQNDDWGGGFDFAAVGAFAFATATPRDAALYNVALPIGSYSLQITGKNNATGIALAEIYDATPASMFTATTPRLANVSARTQVGTGDNILIAGFVIGGTSPVRVLVRAVGPTLGGFGVGGALVDPRLEIFNGSTRIAENDNWGGTAELKAAFSAVAAFALSADNSRDAALVATLQPGNYTAQISGVGNTTGVALVEVYELP